MAILAPVSLRSLGDDFVEAAERALSSGKYEQVPDAELERVMTAAIQMSTRPTGLVWKSPKSTPL